ncbi:MAG: hypothetical protein ACHQ51_15130 [Elusimicrobiota bacterium]
MDTSTLIKTLQDPMGDPFFPVVFQVLMVLTFSLHILLVNATVGAAALAVYGRLRSEERWRRLAAAMSKAVTMSVSALIVLGVAPLLFVQVIYDPFWYSSNNLSAAWVIGFIFVMMGAFGVSYAAHDRGEKPGAAALAGLALALFLLAGVLMHAFGYQALQPEKWLGWYAKGGVVDASGTVLHSFSLPRFLHFIVPAFAVGGVFLMLYAWYLEPRADSDRDYLAWTARLGASLAFWATAAECAGGFWWLASLPPELRFARNPVFLLGAALGAALLALFARVNFSKRRPQESALACALLTVATTLAMSASREALRMGYVGRFGYSVYDQKVSLDWGSTALFLGTFAMGLSILAYVLATAFQAGRSTGRYEAAPRMQAWGRVSIGLLISWIVVVAGLGVAITLRNR